MAGEGAVQTKAKIGLVLDGVQFAITAAALTSVGITTMVGAQTPTDHMWGAMGILLGIGTTMLGSVSLATRSIKLGT